MRTCTKPPPRPLSLAIDAATDNVAKGGGPFGAVIVFPDGRHYFGVNRVTASNDPTAHAEVQAIRAACTAEGDFSLAGAILYTSCEPCPMCRGAALWSRVDSVVYAANRFDAAAAGFDDAAFYALLESGEGVEAYAHQNALAPFDRWRENAQRTNY